MESNVQLAKFLAAASNEKNRPLTEEEYSELLERYRETISATSVGSESLPYLCEPYPDENPIIESRPTVLECDVVRFQNKKDKWVAFVGLVNGRPYEIFTGLMDDEEGISLPKSVTKGRIIKASNPDGTHRYDFQFENKRGYKTTVEGLSSKFNKEYWNYAKLISGVLRYRMPLERVVHLVASLSLDDESINTWKVGVERALKKYIQGIETDEVPEQMDAAE